LFLPVNERHLDGCCFKWSRQPLWLDQGLPKTLRLPPQHFLVKPWIHLTLDVFRNRLSRRYPVMPIVRPLIGVSRKGKRGAMGTLSRHYD
jgi:hypothetical protein